MIDLYRNAWSQACEDLFDVVDRLRDDELNQPTDCAGWTVHDVMAHLAHIEAVLAGHIGDRQPDTGTSSEVTSAYTENGVAERRHRNFAELVDEFARAIGARREQLTEVDADSPAPLTPGNLDWSWETLLRNRAVDVWVHGQDIRRAVDRPGAMDSPAAQVTATIFSYALPLVLAKRVGAQPGTAARWIVDGPVPFDFTVVVGDDGRARFADEPVDPDVTLRMTTEEFTILGAGRKDPGQLDVEVTGNAELARSIMVAMAVTP